MGTFTLRYFLKSFFWRHKLKWLSGAAVSYYGICWDRSAYQKVQMMKGKSLMYRDKIAAIPPGEDVWRW